MSMESLQNAKYREVVSIRFYYDWNTYVLHASGHSNIPNIIVLRSSDQLMEEAVKMMQTHLRAAPTMKKRAKTVLSQRCLALLLSIESIADQTLGTSALLKLGSEKRGQRRLVIAVPIPSSKSYECGA
jgi:hypothetical protein